MNKLLAYIVFLSCIANTQNTFAHTEYPKPEYNEFDEFNQAYECHDTFGDLVNIIVKMIGLRKYITLLINKGYDVRTLEDKQDTLIIKATRLQQRLTDCDCQKELSSWSKYNYYKTANANLVNLATKNDSWHDNRVTDDAFYVLKNFKDNTEETLRRRYSNW